MGITIKNEFQNAKEKRQYLALIFHEYRRIKVQLDSQGAYAILREGSDLYENYQMEVAKFQAFRKLIEDILQIMRPETRAILEHEYVNNESNGWWITTHSHSTYYRIHAQAVDEFLSYFKI